MRGATTQRRDILRLAVPAFLALIAEPLFLLVDSAIIGHLGTAELAGLGVASAALITGAGIFVFLAYGTTSVVARHLGAGDERSAISAGVDGLWLALGLGAVTAAVVAIWAEPICAAFGASPAVLEQATIYLRVSAFGLPGMLVILAVTGVLRGLQDTITPLVASVAGFGVNIALNLLFVYGLHWGIAGSAWGTVIAQTGMAVALVTVLVVKARARQASLHPHPGRVLAAARTGIPLLVRTLALRAVLLLTTWVAASLGDVTLAAHQVALTIWSFLAFALDALAIAAQAIVGRALGAGDRQGVREAMGTMTRWGVWGGFGLGLGARRAARGHPAALHPRPGRAGGAVGGARRRRSRPGGVGLRLRARRRAHRRRRRHLARVGHARHARRLPADPARGAVGRPLRRRPRATWRSCGRPSPASWSSGRSCSAGAPATTPGWSSAPASSASHLEWPLVPPLPPSSGRLAPPAPVPA